jgi:phage shock protein PspC (stress-responsive transcriptional regulator)
MDILLIIIQVLFLLLPVFLLGLLLYIIIKLAVKHGVSEATKNQHNIEEIKDEKNK